MDPAAYCPSLERRLRRDTLPVRIGACVIGGGEPPAVQSMTNTPTADAAASAAQALRIARAGCPIVRLTAQGPREAEALAEIARLLRAADCRVALVADVHFVPRLAALAARHVEKVRINPGNYRSAHGEFEALVELCRSRGAAIRIGVNHGSLAPHMVERWGDTPQGMVASAMEFLHACRRLRFDQVVVSMKSSNTRVMVHAYRLLSAAMKEEGMRYPIHLGVTEAGDGLQGRIKSAVGIGALLADGIGDTLRVSLTEPPENEVPVARMLADHFAAREGFFPLENPAAYSPYEYRRRPTLRRGNAGAGAPPLTHDEIDAQAGIAILESRSANPTAEWRSAILNRRDREPVVIRRRYDSPSPERVAVEAAADMGLLLLDGLADGIWIEAPQLEAACVREIELMILQAARVRTTRTEYIACPGCGRTLYDLQATLQAIRARTSHLTHLKIGVMGCIVNGPGEMADADYGYVGAAPGRITLYKGSEVVERNIPQEQAIEKLVALIRACGDWREPESDSRP